MQSNLKKAQKHLNLKTYFFLGGRLLNGTPGDERSSLIQGIPPLLFVDTDGSREAMQVMIQVGNIGRKDDK